MHSDVPTIRHDWRLLFSFSEAFSQSSNCVGMIRAVIRHQGPQILWPWHQDEPKRPRVTRAGINSGLICTTYTGGPHPSTNPIGIYKS